MIGICGITIKQFLQCLKKRIYRKQFSLMIKYYDMALFESVIFMTIFMNFPSGFIEANFNVKMNDNVKGAMHKTDENYKCPSTGKN